MEWCECVHDRTISHKLYSSHSTRTLHSHASTHYTLGARSFSVLNKRWIHDLIHPLARVTKCRTKPKSPNHQSNEAKNQRNALHIVSYFIDAILTSHNVRYLQVILLLTMCSLAQGTFYPFSRSSLFSPRYRLRPSRSSPASLVQLQTPILGLPFVVPRILMDLLGIRFVR